MLVYYLAYSNIQECNQTIWKPDKKFNFQILCVQVFRWLLYFLAIGILNMYSVQLPTAHFLLLHSVFRLFLFLIN